MTESDCCYERRGHPEEIVFPFIFFAAFATCLQASQLTGVPPENIVLIDDDLSNCLSFFEKGGLAVHVKGDGFAFDNVRVITSSSLLQ